jgi:hypothetical protein
LWTRLKPCFSLTFAAPAVATLFISTFYSVQPNQSFTFLFKFFLRRLACLRLTFLLLFACMSPILFFRRRNKSFFRDKKISSRSFLSKGFLCFHDGILQRCFLMGWNTFWHKNDHRVF